jgi:hypothetical protein
MTWERFRELFEDEYVEATRPDTKKDYRATLDHFERLCSPKRIARINEQTISGFADGLRKEPGYAQGLMQPSTIMVRLQFLHTALEWAVKQKLLPKCPDFPRIKVPKKRCKLWCK